MNITPKLIQLVKDAEKSVYDRAGPTASGFIHGSFGSLIRLTLARGECVMTREVKVGVDVVLDCGVQLPLKNS